MMASGSGVIIDAEEGTFLYKRDQAMNRFLAEGIVDMQAIISDKNTSAISWVFGIAEELMRHFNGRIIRCEAGFIGDEFRKVRLMLDKSRDPILPSVTPAEHFRIIVDPHANWQSYESYLQECKEAFRTHRVFGITGMASRDQVYGIDYCIQIVDELISNEGAIFIVSSGCVFGPGQYALDIVLMQQGTTRKELEPGYNWNSQSECKLQRWDLPPWIR